MDIEEDIKNMKYIIYLILQVKTFKSALESVNQIPELKQDVLDINNLFLGYYELNENEKLLLIDTFIRKVYNYI